MGTNDDFDCTFPSSPSSSDYSSDSYSPHSSNSSSISFLSNGSLKKDSANFEDCFPHSCQHSSHSDHSASGNWHSAEHSSGRRKSSKSGKNSKRRHDSHHHQFHQRHAANMRERKRMQSINDAFEVSLLCSRSIEAQNFYLLNSCRVFDSTFPPYRMKNVCQKWTHFDWQSGTSTFWENLYAQAALRCS